MNTRFSIPASAIILILFKPLSASENSASLPVLVRDMQTGIPLENADVCLGIDSLCRECDSSGTLVFTGLPAGRYTVTATAPDHAPATNWNVMLTNGKNYQLVIDLEKQTVTDLDKMTVHARRKTPGKPSQSTSATRYTGFELSNTAGTADDICRVLSTNPGVVSMPGGTDDNTLYVRGGGTDENVFVIDGLELDNANHFSDVNTSGGAMSFLSGSLVRELDFYTGGFPAQFPPRLSSVVDMHLRNGSSAGYRMETDVNIAGFGFTAEGPVGKKCTFLTNVRMVDLTPLDRFLELTGIPRFGDGLLKLVFTPDDFSTIRILGVGAIDNYHEKFDQYNYTFPTSYDEWIYQGGGIADWIFRKDNLRNTMNFSGSYRRENNHDDAINVNDATAPDTFLANLTEYHRTENIIDSLLLPADTMYIERSIYTGKRLWENDDRRWNVMLKDNLTIFLRDNDQFTAGVVAASNRYRINHASASAGETFYAFTNDSNRQTVEERYRWIAFARDSVLDVRHAGGFAEYVFNGSWFKAVAGLRGDYYTVISDFGFSPRIGLQINPNNSTETFGLSGGLYYQFPSDFNGLIANSITSNPNWDLFSKVPLNDVRLQRNWQGVFRYERQVSETHQMTFETYLKWYDREYPFISPGNRRYWEYSETHSTYTWMLDKANGKKRSYGAEVQFSKNNHDQFYYSLAYSVFRVENRYTDKKWYRDENDVGGVLGLTLGSNFSRNHGISIRIAASGGRPYSAIAKNELGNGFHYDTTKGYYTESLDPVLSANLRYQFTANRKWGSVTGYIEIWNMLDQKPVAQRFFSPSNGYSDMVLNGMIPLAGVKVSW